MPASSPVEGIFEDREDGSSSSVSLSESRWFRRRTSSSVSAALLLRRLADVIMVTPERVDEAAMPGVVMPFMVSLLISTPMKA